MTIWSSRAMGLILQNPDRSPGNPYPAAREGSNAPGIQVMLSQVDSLVQAFWSVAWEDRHRLLRDDGACINPGVNEMHRAAGDLHAVVESLLPRIQPWKCRKQRRMDIDDPALKGPQEFAFQHSHKTCQYNQIHAGLAQDPDVSGFGFVLKLGPEFTRRDVMGWQVKLRRPGEYPGLRHIAQDQADLSLNPAIGGRLCDSDEVGAFARA